MKHLPQIDINKEAHTHIDKDAYTHIDKEAYTHKVIHIHIQSNTYTQIKIQEGDGRKQTHMASAMRENGSR